MTKRKLFMGIHLEMDPSVAIVEDGKVIAFSEEERHTRIKHAPNTYPKEALKFCLDKANCSISEISKLAVNCDLEAYNNGVMKSFYERMRKEYSVDQATIEWQNRNLKKRSWDILKMFHEKEMRKIFGEVKVPELAPFPHHFTHAFQSHMESGFKESLVITIDGSGDHNCTAIWHCKNDILEKIKEINMPNSLGWIY